MKNWGIKYRILLVALLPTTFVSLLLGMLYTSGSTSQEERLIKQKAETIASQLQHVATQSVPANSAGQRMLFRALLFAALDDPDIRSASLWDKNGDIMLYAGPQIQRNRKPVDLADVSYIDDRENSVRTFIRPLTFPQAGKNNRALKENAWLLIDTSLTRAHLAFYQKLLLSTMIGLLGIAAGFLLASRLSQNIQSAVLRITQAIQSLSESHHTGDLKPEWGPEFNKLSHELNHLSEALANAYEEMQQNVDQTTDDLRQTLETIEVQNIELDIARKEALEASRVKSEFLANMSHEIRTPLNGILGFTNLLLKGQLTHSQRDHLLTIKKSSEILLTIINDILDFSKIESGKLQLDRVPLKLRESLEDVLIMLAPTAHHKGLELALLIYEDVPNHIFGDALRIKQVLTNLVSNAVKFTQSGDIVVRAMVEDITDSKAEIKIAVTDTGVGLSAAQQNSLFHAFSQADASTARQFGGTGLGLVISKRLIEEMGGEIGVESEPGKGSTFWFKIPCDLVANPEEEEFDVRLTNERVIVYEAHAPTRLSVVHLLESWGVRVNSVDSLKKLLDLVSKKQNARKGFALAMIGVTRFDLESAQLRTVVRELEVNRNCRTLLMTPTVDENEFAVLDQVACHLVKPVSGRRLHDSLVTLITGQAPVQSEMTNTQEESLYPTPAKKPLILAVDDNEANLKLVDAFLKELNVNVHTATSGFDALSKVKKHRYDLIFMDVQMPGMDGVETTRKIREIDHHKGGSTPIVALTAHALVEEKQKLLSSGFDDYLTKPINELQLKDVIQRKTGYRARPRTGQTEPAGVIRPLQPSARITSGPCVDIDASIALSGGKADLAEELFSMLLEHLIDDYEAIRDSYENDDREQLMHRVHKLHGATKYCGVPELRLFAERFEIALKRNKEPLYEDYKNLISAITRVQNWAEHNDWPSLFRTRTSTTP